MSQPFPASPTSSFAAVQETASGYWKARQPHPDYPDRVEVPDDRVEWWKPWVEYTPRPFTSESVKLNNRMIKEGGWADPEDVLMLRDDWVNRSSSAGPFFFNACGMPLNPCGRTGISERGKLGKWGPNLAADPIVTRFHPPGSSQVQVVAIKRRDTGLWALPGGMVDAGEKVSTTLRREFAEEAAASESEEEKSAFAALVNELFRDGNLVYRGYVDDPRNTDNAWMETTAIHFHCTEQLASRLTLRAGDDAVEVTWLDVNENEPRYVNLYASHKEWVDQVARALPKAVNKGPPSSNEIQALGLTLSAQI